MNGPLVIVAYRPKAGQAATLSALLRDHQDLLQQRGFVHGGHEACVVLDENTTMEITDYKDDDSRVRAMVDPDVIAVRLKVETLAESVSRIDLS